MFRIARFIVTAIVAAWLLTLAGPVLTAHAATDPGLPPCDGIIPVELCTPVTDPTTPPPVVTDPPPAPPVVTDPPPAPPVVTDPPPAADWTQLSAINDPRFVAFVALTDPNRAAFEVCSPQRWIAGAPALDRPGFLAPVVPEVVVTWPGTVTDSVACPAPKPVADPTDPGKWGGTGTASPWPVRAALLCNPARWVAEEPLQGAPPSLAQGDILASKWWRLVVPEEVVTWPGSAAEARAGCLTTKTVAKPQVPRIPVGGIPTGDGSTIKLTMLPRTGPVYPTWALGTVALGCLALGGLMVAFGRRPPARRLG